jgi:hypothetical protein
MTISRGIPLDAALPALPELLPIGGAPELVAGSVGRMTGAECDPSRGCLEYFEYRPHERCRILWSFPSETGRPVLVSGKLFSDDGGSRLVSRPSFQRLAGAAAALGPTDGRCYEYDAERKLLLQLFPLDSKLPALIQAASLSWLREAFASSCGVPAECMNIIGAEVVSYKPGRRCTWRLVLQTPRARYAFLKVFPDDRGRFLEGALRTVRSQFVKQGVPWDIPEPLFCVADGEMLVMEAIDSATESKELVARAATDPGARQALYGLVESAAEGLHQFQWVEVSGLPTRDSGILLEKLQKDTQTLHELQQTAPGVAEAVTNLVRRLKEEATQLDCERVGLGHGSFRHTHFLLRGRRPVLVDLEGLCLRGASGDAGDFLAYLDWLASRQPQFAPILDECERIFLRGVSTLPALSPRWLAWHRAAAQVKWALRAFASLAPGWVEAAERLLRLAEEGLPARRTSARGAEDLEGMLKARRDAIVTGGLHG